MTYERLERGSSSSRRSCSSSNVSEATSIATNATSTKGDDIPDMGKKTEKGKEKRKRMKNKYLDASRFVQRSRQSMDALRHALHLGGR